MDLNESLIPDFFFHFFKFPWTRFILTLKTKFLICTVKKEKENILFHVLYKDKTRILRANYTVIWNKNGIDEQYKLQKRVVRVIKNNRFYSSTSEILQQLNWVPLADYFVYRSIILVFQALPDLTPNYLDIFKVCKWNKYKINQIKPKYCIVHFKGKDRLLRRSFTVHGALLWNNLSLFLTCH